MCILHCLSVKNINLFFLFQVCSRNLNSNQIGEFILPHLLKSLKDKVPNVRFFSIKLFEIIITNCDQATKEKIKG